MKNNFEIIKIGFDYENCSKKGNIITGCGLVYYYATQNDYDKCNETFIVEFSFKYNLDSSKIFDVECDDEDAKYRVEKNEDDFIDNLKNNLIPSICNNESNQNKDITDDMF